MQQMQAAFRGSGGYSLLRRQLLRLLNSSDDIQIANSAGEVADRLGYELN
jgi:hypothetical protein